MRFFAEVSNRSIGEELLQGLGVTQKQLHHQKSHTNKGAHSCKICSPGALNTAYMQLYSLSFFVQFGWSVSSHTHPWTAHSLLY